MNITVKVLHHQIRTPADRTRRYCVNNCLKTIEY